MDLGLKDRVYIVTGASRGLGRATADALAADGAKVVVSSRNADSVASAVQEIGEDRAAGVVADNAAEDTPGRLISAARERFGRLDGALISVGGPPATPVTATTDEQWRAGFETVFLGAVRLATSVADALEPGGSIALVLSTSVRVPLGGLAISNGLRPALAGVAKALVDELGPRGVRVNGLLPGSVETERTKELSALHDDPAAARAEAERGIPLGRYGEPAEFGRVAAFLLSPAASYVNGAMLPVDGGSTRAI